MSHTQSETASCIFGKCRSSRFRDVRLNSKKTEHVIRLPTRREASRLDRQSSVSSRRAHSVPRLQYSKKIVKKLLCNIPGKAANLDNYE